MSEIGYAMRRLREKGLWHYLSRPRYLWKAARYLGGLVGERWSPRTAAIYVLEMPVTRQQASPGISVRSISSVEPSLADFARAREREDPAWREGSYYAELAQRFSRGDTCFAAERNGRVASVVFSTLGQTKLEKVEFVLPFPPGVVGAIDGYTLAEFRGQHLYEATFRKLIDAFVGTEFDRLYGFILPENVVSLRAHERIGLRRIALRVSMWQRWGIRRHVVRRMNVDVAELAQLSCSMSVARSGSSG